MKRKPRRKPTPAPTRYTIDMGVTQSILQDFLACRYRAHLQRAGWEPKRQKKSFRFGSLIHDCLEFAYAGIRAGLYRPGAAFEIGIAARIKNLVAANHRAAGPTDNLTEIEQEGAWAEALLAGYFDYWGEDWAREWIAVEGKFDQQVTMLDGVDLYGTDAYRLRGRRDGVFASAPKKGPQKGQFGLWLLETKTKGQIDEDALDLTLAFDFQSLYYLLTLAEENPTNYPIRGCLYNIVRKPGLRKLKAGKQRKRAETDAEFIARTKEDIKKRPDHYYKRYELIFPPAVRAEFRRELGLQLAEFRLWLAGKLPTYRNPTACVTKYKCQFLDHCASGNFAAYARTRNPFAELEVPDGGKAHRQPQRKKARRKKA